VPDAFGRQLRVKPYSRRFLHIRLPPGQMPPQPSIGGLAGRRTVLLRPFRACAICRCIPTALRWAVLLRPFRAARRRWMPRSTVLGWPCLPTAWFPCYERPEPSRRSLGALGAAKHIRGGPATCHGPGGTTQPARRREPSNGSLHQMLACQHNTQDIWHAHLQFYAGRPSYQRAPLLPSDATSAPHVSLRCTSGAKMALSVFTSPQLACKET